MAPTASVQSAELEAAFASAAAGQRVVVQRGTARVALVPEAYLAELEELERLADGPELAASQAAWAEFVASGEPAVTLEQVRRELGLE